MSAIFITATGTDIGKTFVTAGLIRHFRTVGGQVDALKPVVTGFNQASVENSDTGLLLSALGRPLQPAEIDRISPWRFGPPLSPDMAARKEGHPPVEFDDMLDFCRRAILACPGTLLIEGIGGVMVPLDARHTTLDWIAALNIPVVLVAGSYLGSLSHTLTAIHALHRRDLVIQAFVVNETANSPVPMADTIATLRNFSGSVPIAGFLRGASNFAELAGLL
jgi:dethiobiotin synthetase